MSCSTITTIRPSVWIGCLACYNGGRLVGDWHDAEDAGEVTPEDLHGNPTARDEMWVFDLEGFPSSTGEMSPPSPPGGTSCSMRSEKRSSGLPCWHGCRQGITSRTLTT